jgi:phospholipase C
MRLVYRTIVGAGLLLGCSSTEATPGPPLAGDGGDATLASDASRPTDDQASAARAACTYRRGALPEQTLGPSTPTGAEIPIQTIVVLMQENRSFDSYFAHLNAYAHRSDIESAPDTASNPDSLTSTNPVPQPFQHGPHRCALDTDHEWSGSHIEYDNGKMDGFYVENNGFGPGPDGGAASLLDGDRALWWYDQTDIPFYYALASTFAMGDHYHCSLLGPTWPNRMYLYAATSFGRTTGDFPDISAYSYPGNPAGIFDELEAARVSWNIYGDGTIGAEVVYGLGLIDRFGRNPILLPSDFFNQATMGTLPQVVFVDPHLGSQGPSRNDEHPPADIQVGQMFISSVIQALFTSPQWPHVAIFFTYDEHGGLYDHVAPPLACPPDNTAPILAPGDMTQGDFDRLGVRVPFMVISPYAKPAFVSHTVHDHTSITRFIEARFGLPALTARDANADPLMEFFDFSNPAFLTPPNIPAPTVDQTELDYCVQTFINVPSSPL